VTPLVIAPGDTDLSDANVSQ